MKRSDLPFGSEFSPSQIELSRVLEFAAIHGGKWRAFENEIKITYFEQNDTTDHNKRKLANNTKLGMIAYGLIDREAELTSFGRFLYNIRADEEKLSKELARRILKNLHGMTLVQCVQDMMAAGETVTLVSLREELAARNVHFPSGGKHPSMMRLWLAKAGGFIGGGWRVDATRLEEVLGISAEEFEALAHFTPEQRAFLKALANMGESRSYPSNEVAKLAAATYGIKFNEKSLPRLVLNTLEGAGYIVVTRTTSGRGAKPPTVAPTQKLAADLIKPLFEQLERQTTADIRPLLRRPLTEILQELQHDDKHLRGLALEALAFKLMRLLDLTYVATRLRGTATGGAEVDVIFQGARLMFSRWQVQCKNTALVRLDDVAKEVGLTHMLKSNVIVMVTTGEVGEEARGYANKVMRDSNLCVVMVDGTDLARVRENPASIVEVFGREARHAMQLKTLELS